MNNLATRLAEVMEELHLEKDKDLAAFCGVSAGLVAQWFSGATKLGPKPLRAFSRTHFSLDWIAEGRLPKYRKDLTVVPTDAASERRRRVRNELEDAPAITGNLKRIPIVGRVQAGPDGFLQIDDYSAGDGDGFMIWYAASPDAYALRIRGESMSPRYLPGEIVGVDPSVEVQPNDETIVILRDGRRMIKRFLWSRDGQACFESVNKNFPNIVLDLDEIDKLHLVSGHIPKAAFRME